MTFFRELFYREGILKNVKFLVYQFFVKKLISNSVSYLYTFYFYQNLL